MDDVRLDQPVPILGPSREVEYVTTAGEAVDYLLHNWPDMDGPMHRIAREVLHDLLIGEATPRQARIAFEAAADEVELSVGGWHGNNPLAKFISRFAKSPIGREVPRPRRGARSKTSESRT